MLIRFTVENFRSFDDEAVFSLLPGRMSKHENHIIAGQKHGIDVVKTALIYGANASGKSNLIRAMAFARDLIISGTRLKQAIPVEPFRLNKDRLTQPSRFEFEFAIGEQAYAYGFAADRVRVYEEWLYTIDSKDEKLLFERTTPANNQTKAKFASSVEKDKEDRQFFRFVARGTRPNQLLLTELAEKNVDFIAPLYSWFRYRLAIVFPDSQYNNIQLSVHRDQQFSQSLATFLRTMNTGIDEVCTKRVDIESINFPLDLIHKELEILNADIADRNEAKDEDEKVDNIIGLDTPTGRFLIYRDETGSVQAHSLSTRRFVDDDPIEFDLFEESDGTQRLFDLFPVLYNAQGRIFVIDELERSLHPNLVHRFIRQFLDQEGGNQLIVSTHESTLLDLTLFRRDEIWFVEKSPAGASTIYSLDEFKPRHDFDIRKGYLQGRFGAIPVFGSALQEG